jgi:hypothetical protein
MWFVPIVPQLKHHFASLATLGRQRAIRRSHPIKPDGFNMGNAFIIEVSGHAAGIVTNERNRFRFYASDPAMASLDGQLFGSPKAAESAAERLTAETVVEPPDRGRIK